MLSLSWTLNSSAKATDPAMSLGSAGVELRVAVWHGPIMPRWAERIKNESPATPPAADLHLLAVAFDGSFGDFIRSGGNDAAAAEGADALASCLALIPARSPEGLAEKAAIIRARLIDSTVAELLADVGLDSPDGALVLSFAQDALALAGE
jgi:hypothetical protein